MIPKVNMRFSASLFAALSLLAMPMPALAGPFDGKWFADIPAQNRCNAVSSMELVVADGQIMGKIHNPANVVSVDGKVDDNGNATFTVIRPGSSETWSGTMKFQNDRFEATWFNGGCDRHAEGNRAPSAEQQAAMAAERKDHQAAYADLVRRAEAGEKVDYAKLRAEYVYAESWDFYGGKVNGLITGADAADKGKDCPAALEKVDQVLALDFTVILAHSIRSDCLSDSDRGRARIESNIADGLTDSLMNSGDGDSEKTAYVVSTQHEEDFALLNRHIQLKARQTEVRGSDGHYYDEIQGISIRSSYGFYGGTSTSVSTKTVYFNVDTFVKGRESRRAAMVTAAATVQ
jgi:hypothetical protein